LLSWSGAIALTAVAVLAVVAVSTTATVTYLVFPALIWAAWQFRAQGATVAVLITAGITIGMTADNLGAFSRQEINKGTLNTQLYIAVAALTSLLLSAVVSERERSITALEQAKRREGEQAEEERYRLARELHDSVSQVLFSTALQVRTAEKTIAARDAGEFQRLSRALTTIGGLVRTAQTEMRALIYELRRNSVEGGLARAVARHAEQLNSETGLNVTVVGSREPLPLPHGSEVQLFAIVREALANVVRHSQADWAHVSIERDTTVVSVHVRDNGCGFDLRTQRDGHYGLESIRGRASELGGVAEIVSSPGAGTSVEVEIPLGGVSHG
jgi:signal transduction histidine kinase